jgi:hypothetical protein
VRSETPAANAAATAAIAPSRANVRPRTAQAVDPQAWRIADAALRRRARASR